MLKSWMCLVILLQPVAETFASDDNIVVCEAELTEYLTDQPYTEFLTDQAYLEEIDGSYEDFVAPIATFAVVSPSEFDGRRIRVVFVSTDHVNILSDLKHGVGGRFVLRIPMDYFDYSDGTTIKAHQVESISPAE
jgi:hypothetical protein